MASRLSDGPARGPGEEGGLVVSVPASSANLGPGFDALGMALTIRAEVGVGTPPPTGHAVDEHHPATVAYRRGGGTGELWVRSPIPMGRGLGYSGAVRLGGALAALVRDEEPGPAMLDRAFEIAADLEGHADNVAASLLGGVTVTAAGHAVRVPLALEAEVVLWIPAATTSTNRSRATLPDEVTFADATDNVGRTALLVAALAAGRQDVLRAATVDRLHQVRRLTLIEGAADALDRAVRAGAWCAWLSGSGPTVAALCPAGSGEVVAADVQRWSSTVGLDAGVRCVGIDQVGVTVQRSATSRSA